MEPFESRSSQALLTKEPDEVERRYISETLSDEFKIEGAITIYIRLFTKGIMLVEMTQQNGTE